MKQFISKAMDADEREQGFTLIELLVVIIIIGILAAIAIPVFLNQRKKAVDAGVKSDLGNAAIAAETYSTDNPTAANFGATAAAAKANLLAAGFNATTTDNVLITGGPATGYCIKGYNTAGNTTASSAYWYDSSNGGLQPGAPTAAPAGLCTTGTFLAVN